MIINYFSPILQDILLLVCVCLSAHTESVLAILRLPVPKLACFLYPSPPLASSSNFSFTHCHNWIPYCVILAIIYTWLPPHSYFLLCIIQKCFSEHTHASAHTHTYTPLPDHQTYPSGQMNAVQNDKYLETLLSLLHRKNQKDTHTLADNSRLTQFSCNGIIK